MKAVVLVGGAGTRLYPLTTYVPKALIPVGGKPVIDHILNYLERHGIREVLLLSSDEDHEATGNHLGDRFGQDMAITYDVRARIGTAGAIGPSHLTSRRHSSSITVTSWSISTLTQ